MKATAVDLQKEIQDLIFQINGIRVNDPDQDLFKGADSLMPTDALLLMLKLKETYPVDIEDIVTSIDTYTVRNIVRAIRHEA